MEKLNRQKLNPLTPEQRRTLQEFKVNITQQLDSYRQLQLQQTSPETTEQSKQLKIAIQQSIDVLLSQKVKIPTAINEILIELQLNKQSKNRPKTYSKTQYFTPEQLQIVDQFTNEIVTKIVKCDSLLENLSYSEIQVSAGEIKDDTQKVIESGVILPQIVVEYIVRFQKKIEKLEKVMKKERYEQKKLDYQMQKERNEIEKAIRDETTEEFVRNVTEQMDYYERMRYQGFVSNTELKQINDKRKDLIAEFKQTGYYIPKDVSARIYEFTQTLKERYEQDKNRDRGFFY